MERCCNCRVEIFCLRTEVAALEYGPSLVLSHLHTPVEVASFTHARAPTHLVEDALSAHALRMRLFPARLASAASTPRAEKIRKHNSR